VVGYSIGYGVLHDPDDASRVFSMWHNFCGCVMTAGYVALILRWSVNKKPDWRVAAVKSSQSPGGVTSTWALDPEMDMSRVASFLWQKAKTVFMQIVHSSDRHLLVLLIYVLFGISWTCA